MRKLLASAMAAAAIVSAAPAIASDHERASGQGGFDIGPLGQCFDARACGRGYYRGYSGYAFVAPYRYYHRNHRYYRY